MINVYFGGSLHQDLGHYGSIHWGHVHAATTAAGSTLRSLYGKNLEVHSYHHQASKETGTKLRIAATAPDGITEAVEHISLPILGVQFHPEAGSKMNGTPIFRQFIKTCKQYR